MKLNKFLLTAAAVALCGAAATAQEFDDFGSFGDFGSDDGGFSFSSGSSLEVGGSTAVDVRAYVDLSDADDADASDVEIDAVPAATLDLRYSGNKSDIQLNLKIDEATVKNYPEDIIDELVLRGYFGNFTVEAGKMKVVWGKGDKLHVIDNFNADDYTDFIIPDYLDRRISTPMIRGIYSFPVANLRLEGIYTPFLPVDRFATSGRWTPAQVTSLTNAVTSAASGKVAAAFEDYTTATATVGAAGAAYTIASESAATAATALATATAAYDTALANYTAAATAYQTAATSGEGKVDNAAVIKAYADAMAALAAASAAKETAQTTYDGYASGAETAAAAYAEAKEAAETAGAAYMYALTYANALSADPDVIYPDLWNLKYSQFGGRATWTLGQFDLGVSYYNGYYKQPSFNASKLDSFVTSYLASGTVSDDDKFLSYDKKQTFGLEASTVLWHFNLRGEAAYNLTKDTDGTDPWVHNNSIQWLGGFDIDLPFWNANLNVQEYGTAIIHGSDCDDNTAYWAAYGASDVDYNVNGYTNNKLAVNFTTSFLNDKIAPEVTVVWGIENGDLAIMPKFAFKPDQNLTLSATGLIILCRDDDSEFAAWKKNSFVSVGATYQF